LETAIPASTATRNALIANRPARVPSKRCWRSSPVLVSARTGRTEEDLSALSRRQHVPDVLPEVPLVPPQDVLPVEPDVPDVLPDVPDVPPEVFPDVPLVPPDVSPVLPDVPDVLPVLPDVLPDVPDVPHPGPPLVQPDVPLVPPDVLPEVPDVLPVLPDVAPVVAAWPWMSAQIAHASTLQPSFGRPLAVAVQPPPEPGAPCVAGTGLDTWRANSGSALLPGLMAAPPPIAFLPLGQFAVALRVAVLLVLTARTYSTPRT
jgi:signal-induced proliferation-associated 1 like protein 3